IVSQVGQFPARKLAQHRYGTRVLRILTPLRPSLAERWVAQPGKHANYRHGFQRRVHSSPLLPGARAKRGPDSLAGKREKYTPDLCELAPANGIASAPIVSSLTIRIPGGATTFGLVRSRRAAHLSQFQGTDPPALRSHLPPIAQLSAWRATAD